MQRREFLIKTAALVALPVASWIPCDGEAQDQAHAIDTSSTESPEGCSGPNGEGGPPGAQDLQDTLARCLEAVRDAHRRLDELGIPRITVQPDPVLPDRVIATIEIPDLDQVQQAARRLGHVLQGVLDGDPASEQQLIELVNCHHITPAHAL